MAKQMGSTNTKGPIRMVLSDQTYSSIRSMLLNHEIAPGARIKIDGLAKNLDVSQTPVREALARLESEDLVTKSPLRGYAATQLLTVEQLDDLFQFRAIIEPWAAASAARRTSQDGIDALKRELKKGQAAGELGLDDAYAAMSEHDARFHELIASLSGSDFVRDAFVRTHCHLHLFRFVDCQRGSRTSLLHSSLYRLLLTIYLNHFHRDSRLVLLLHLRLQVDFRSTRIQHMVHLR